MSIARIEQACAALPDDWLRPARDAGIARFAANGFPSTRHEDWKYTDLGAVAERRVARACGIEAQRGSAEGGIQIRRVVAKRLIAEGRVRGAGGVRRECALSER